MKEQRITFGVARLAKEKGFDLRLNDIYYNGKLDIRTLDELDNIPDFVCDAPTQSLLQKWLREKHELYVYCIPNVNVLGVWHYVVEFKNKVANDMSVHYNTYEEALEDGLIKALKLIKR